MKETVVVYGNCHTAIITQMLESYPEFNDKYFIIPTKRIQDIKDSKELYDDSYRKCDVFIHQSIRLNNRYGEEYASEKIISRLKAGCRVISIPNVYHLPLCFFPQYSNAKELRRNGITYFFRDSIIDSHVDKPFKLASLVKLDYENPYLFDRSEIISSFESFINKVRKREEDWDIKVSDFIINTYRSHQLFYDPNHPTNFFLSYITAELLKLLLNRKNVDLKMIRIDNCLDTIEMPICRGVIEALQLEWKNDTIRKSMPITNRSNNKMNLCNYVYQYMSCIWITNDFSFLLNMQSRVLWILNTLTLKIQKIYNVLIRK